MSMARQTKWIKFIMAAAFYSEHPAKMTAISLLRILMM